MPVQTDAYDLTVEIERLTNRLDELNGELRQALDLHVEATVQLEKAKAAVSAARAEIRIVGSTLIAKQSVLKALPR